MNNFVVNGGNTNRANTKNKICVSNSVVDSAAVLVEISKLKEHENIDLKYLDKLKEEIKKDGVLKIAVAVDRNTNVIIDGHHRVSALKELGYTKIAVIYVDYRSPTISVQRWELNKNITHKNITKETVIYAGLNNKKLPPKTSKHFIRINDQVRHISAVEKLVNLPLEKLRDDKTEK